MTEPSGADSGPKVIEGTLNAEIEATPVFAPPVSSPGGENDGD